MKIIIYLRIFPVEKVFYNIIIIIIIVTPDGCNV